MNSSTPSRIVFGTLLAVSIAVGGCSQKREASSNRDNESHLNLPSHSAKQTPPQALQSPPVAKEPPSAAQTSPVETVQQPVVVPQEDKVPDAASAKRIAKRVLKKKFGPQILENRTFNAKLKNGVWRVYGKLARRDIVSAAIVEIEKESGHIRAANITK